MIFRNRLDFGVMTTRTKYQHLQERSDNRSREPFVRGTGIRASTIWHDLPKLIELGEEGNRGGKKYPVDSLSQASG
jgi:hypothetical protein